MKKNMKTQNIIFTAIIAFVAGAAGSWFVFGGKEQAEVAPVQTTTQADVSIWTCSMHPQIRQNEPGLCPICEMDLITLESNSSDNPLVLEMSESAVALANIQTTVIGSTSAGIKKPITLNGRIKQDERRISSQVSHVPGRIEKLYVSFTGEEVEKGQKLAEVYSPELITAQRELIEASKMAENNALLEAARNKLRYWKIPEQTIKEIETSGASREMFPVYATESGVVSKRKVSTGDHIESGGILFELINLERLWVLFEVYEKDLANIKLGQQIDFTSNSYPSKKFSSRISFIDPVIDPQTRVAKVRTDISNKGGILKPEMFVTGTLSASKNNTKTEKLSVPKSAVMWTGKKSVAYVKLKETEIPSFEYREIELGEAIGDRYMVISGLEQGDEVVSNGSFVIDAAAQLNNQASMMNRDIGIKKEAVGLPDFSAETPSEFKSQLHNLAKSYLVIKDALVASDSELSNNAIPSFLESLENVDMSLVKDEAHMFWMEQLDILNAHIEKLSETTDIEVQRKQFEFISEALITSIKAFGLDTGKLYVQYCPMAFNNRGAAWLSNQEQIRNPYFGDKMLKCGVVKDIFE
jgi:membrane fusion protein, copper/silver efflux system